MVLVLNERKKADFIDEKTIMDLLYVRLYIET